MNKLHILNLIVCSLLSIPSTSLSMEIQQSPSSDNGKETSTLPQANFYYKTKDGAYTNIANTSIPAKKFNSHEKHGSGFLYFDNKRCFIQPTDYVKDIHIGKPIEIQKPSEDILFYHIQHR